MNLIAQYPQLKVLQELCRKSKTKIYLVGGFVRDYLLGHTKNDFDFAVERHALKLARSFANKIKGAYVLLDEERGCARVVKKETQRICTFDFADFRDKTLQKDLTLRDFTINTLVVDLLAIKSDGDLDDYVKDYKKGRKDLKTKRLRMVAKRAFRDDPLRMVRAFSLRASLGLSIARATLAQIKKDKDLLRDVSPERVRDELFKILATPRAAAILTEMDKIDLLEKIIPQIRVMNQCLQGGYHHLDVWPHSLETVVQMEGVLAQLKDQEVIEYIQEKLGGDRSRAALMKLAVLLHDIGKPATRKKENGRTSFHGHEHVGKEIVHHIAKMLKLSKHERHILEDMVRWHLRPGYLSNFKQPSEKAIYRYFRDTKEEAVSILLLSLADQRATRGPLTTEKDQEHHEKICLDLIQRYFDKKKEKPFIRLITGNDLIKRLKLKPSPLFGEILTKVEEEQSLGKLKTRDEAVDLAKRIAEQAKKKGGR